MKRYNIIIIEILYYVNANNYGLFLSNKTNTFPNDKLVCNCYYSTGRNYRFLLVYLTNVLS